MKFHYIVAIVLGLILIPVQSMAVRIDTGGKSEAELSSEMVRRCQHQMGEFGNEGVNMCIESETAARKALDEYPDEIEDIADRCYRTKRKVGWYLVKRCTDDNAAAKEALQSYPAEHTSIVEACEDEFGRRRYDLVLQCADARIAKQAAGD